MKMQAVSRIAEIEKITRLMSAFKRSPQQLNKIYESDAEILDFGLEKNIVITADALCEELEWKLISDPYIIGWINVVSSLSDLAAVDASPLGVLIGLSKAKEHDLSYCSRFWKGTQEALAEHSTFLLGGDTNDSKSFLVSCTAIGQRSKSTLLSRKGIEQDDAVYVTGPVGMGTATGFANFVIKNQSANLASDIEKAFKPKARFKEAAIISRYASACIDTSDGLLAAIDFLCEINGFHCSLLLRKEHFHPICHQLVSQLKVPLILFSSIHLGEFELAFTIPKKNKTTFEAAMKQNHFSFFEIGRMDSRLDSFEINAVKVDLNPIRNLLNDIKNPAFYLNEQQIWSESYRHLIAI